jgi:hypothetical protein
MDNIEHINELFKNLESKNDTIRYEALKELLNITDNKVPWIYEKWSELTGRLSSDNSYQRSIGIMLLANLCKSDIENRTGSIIEKYLETFDDEKFITSRQSIQNVWKLALNNDSNKNIIIRQLEREYSENIHLNRHGNLIKQDIIGSLSKIYQRYRDEDIMNKIKELIDSETDEKFRKTLNKITKG